MAIELNNLTLVGSAADSDVLFAVRNLSLVRMTRATLLAGLAGGISADSVTNTLLANMAANTVKANITSGDADPQDVSLGTFKTWLGVSNVDNTSDANKPVSTAVAAAIAALIPLSQKGAANGVAPLGSDSKIAAIYLPSYVDDIVEAANFAALPATGEAGKIYVTLDTNLQYRWGGSAYTQLVSSPGTTDAVVEGATNKYFTEARVRAAPLTGFALGSTAQVAAADSMLVGIQKLQAQVNTKGTVLSSLVIPLSGGAGTIDCTTNLGDGTTHANRPLYSTANGDFTIAISGGADSDVVQHINRGTGTKTYTGVTAADGCTVAVAQNQVFFAVRDNGQWRSFTPNYAAIAAGVSAGAPVTVTGATPVGSILTCNTSPGWVGTGFQWTRNGVDIPGATSQTYQTVSADGSTTVTCKRTGIPYIPTGITVDAAASLKPSVVQYASSVGDFGSSCTTTFGSAINTANYAVMVFALGDGEDPTSVQFLTAGDVVLGTLTSLYAINIGTPGLLRKRHFYGGSIPATAAKVRVNFASGRSYNTQHLYEIANVHATPVSASFGEYEGFAAAPWAFSITTAHDDALILAQWEPGAAPTGVTPAGYTLRSTSGGAPYMVDSSPADTGAAGVKTHNMTSAGSGYHAVAAIAIRGA